MRASRNGGGPRGTPRLPFPSPSRGARAKTNGRLSARRHAVLCEKTRSSLGAAWRPRATAMWAKTPITPRGVSWTPGAQTPKLHRTTTRGTTAISQPRAQPPPQPPPPHGRKVRPEAFFFFSLFFPPSKACKLDVYVWTAIPVFGVGTVVQYVTTPPCDTLVK